MNLAKALRSLKQISSDKIVQLSILRICFFNSLIILIGFFDK